MNRKQIEFSQHVQISSYATYKEVTEYDDYSHSVIIGGVLTYWKLVNSDELKKSEVNDNNSNSSHSHSSSDYEDDDDDEDDEKEEW
jgi:hypothetical protein